MKSVDDVTLTMDDLSHDPDFYKLRTVFSSVFKLDLTHATVRIRIPKINYQIEKLHTKPLGINVQDPLLDLNLKAYIGGITTSLSAGLDLDLMIQNPKSNKAESYLSAHLSPTTIIVPDTIEPLSFNLQFETKRDQQEFNYQLKNYDLTSVPEYIDRHMNELSILETNKNVPISAQSISVNPVIVRLGSLTRTIDFDVFKPILQKKLNQIITLIMTSLGKSLQLEIGPQILKNIFSNKTRSDLVVKNDHVYTRFLTSSFSQPVPDQLFLGVTGELCTTELFQQYHEQCNQQSIFPAPVRIISKEDQQKAADEVTENLAQAKSDLVLSMSEEYLNRLLHVTIQANLWNDSLEKQHLALGPKGAFLVFDKRTATPELYLDILYAGEGKGVESLLVNNSRPLRFPLRISTELDFISVDGIPHMIIKTEKILSSANEIINGIPKYDLPSHLIFGFKKAIAKMILKMSAEIEGQTALDLDLPILKDIELEKTWHEASPFGRLNLFFKL